SQNAFGSAYLTRTRTGGSNIADRYFFGSDKSSEQFIVDANLIYETSFENVDSRTLVGAEYNDFESTNYGLYQTPITPIGPKDLPGTTPPINWLNPVYSGGPTSTAPN